MSKLPKIIAATVIILAVIVLLAVFLAIVFFPGDKIKTIAEEKMSEALGIPVSIESVGLSFAGIPSVKVSNITVGQTSDGEPPLFSLESAHMRINLLKLLSRKVEIVLVQLEKPEVVIVNREDGSSNIPPSKEKPAAETDSDQPPSLPLPVTLRTLLISGGRVALDNSGTTGSVISLEGIDVTMSVDIGKDLKAFGSTGKTLIANIALTDTKKKSTLGGIDMIFEHELTGDITAGAMTLTRGDLSVNGLPVAVTAGVERWTKTSFSVSIDKLDIVDLLKAAPAGMIPDQDKLSAEGSFTLTVDGTVDTEPEEPVIEYAGRLDVYVANLAFAGLPKSVDSIRSHIDFSEKAITIGETAVSIGGSGVTLSGTISDYATEPVVSVTSKGDIDFDDIKDAVPLPEGTDIRGAMTFSVAMDGRPSDPATFRASGGAKINGVTAVMPETFKHPADLDGSITLSPAAVGVDRIVMTSGTTDLMFAGRITNYMTLAGLGEDDAVFTGTVRSKTVDLNDLLVTPEKKEPAGTKPWDLEETVKTLPIPPKLSGNLDIALGNVVFGRLKANSAKGRVTFGKGVFALKDMNVAAYAGRMTGSTSLDITDPENATYGGGFTLKAFDSAQFIADFLGIGEIVRGKLSSSLSFSGAGLDSVSMLDNLRASGDMNFSDGQFVNWPFTRKLGEHLKFLDFETLDFDSIVNTFTVENRKLITPDMALTTKFGDMVVAGTAGFDTSVDYDITINLDKKTSSKALEALSSLTKYIESKPERLELNVKAGGTFLSPRFTLDTSAAEDVLKDSLKQQLSKEVDKLLESKDAEELKEKGKQLLKGLLKK